jgi:hypothetical protein
MQVEVLEGAVHLLKQQIVSPLSRAILGHQLLLFFIDFDVELEKFQEEVRLVEISNGVTVLFDSVLNAMRR